MKKYQILQFLEASNLENSSLWIAEAEFGYSHLKAKIESLQGENEILEVGCGSGILLSMLAEEFPQHVFNGIEPFGMGFTQLNEINAVVRKMGVNLKIEAYENHETAVKYDLIYCVNVFEHVDDWRNFIDWAASKLDDGGVFFVICPNYGFPYESHFRIPIIFNKKITHQLFKQYINSFEQRNGWVGSWASLNFVKKKEVRNFINQKKQPSKFKMQDDLAVIDNLVERVVEDVEFRKRQRFIGGIAVMMKKIGVFKLIKLFPNYIPYMKLIFYKR
ncbi:class I SAM-dependent methyltransferase [Pseudomonadales bacterium]|nr:class I SAM-dependent methyltransferase [Pseudomonadales bacterium]